MNFLFKLSDDPVSFEENRIHTLIIENKKLFRSVLTAFEFGVSEEYFVFSENFTPFDFDKKGFYIGNVLNVDINNKKLSTKINGYLEKITNDELYVELSEVKSALLGLGDALSDFTDYDFSFKQDFDTLSIVKFLNFSLCKDDFTEEEILLKFTFLLAKYLGIKLFVTANLFLYFEKDELKQIFETIILNNMFILDIEGFNPECLREYCDYHIIDKDLCSIDNNENY